MRRGLQPQVALLVAGCVCLGVGCALPALSPGVDPVSRRSHTKRAIAAASQDVGREADEALSLLEQQEFGKALEKIRRQLQQPRFNSRDYLAALREAAIEILGEYQSFHGFSPQLDAEAKRYYEEALIYTATDRERRAELVSIYANYFSNTDRNGLALEAFNYELNFAENAGDDYRAIKALDALANVYHDMGDLPQRDQLRSEALRRAAEFFVVGVNSSSIES
jgi:tetratricopeptide (TPR) repeat protein